MYCFRVKDAKRLHQHRDGAETGDVEAAVARVVPHLIAAPHLRYDVEHLSR